MGFIIWTIFLISLFLGVTSLYYFITHPLSDLPGVKYPGKKFWLVAFICLIVLYLKS